MESEGNQRGKIEGSHHSNEETIGNTNADNELPSASDTSILSSTTDSMRSTASETSITDDLEKTVIEVSGDIEEVDEPDYKGLYESYKRLLDGRTEHLKSEMSALKNDDYNHLRESYRELENQKETIQEELKAKVEHISNLEAQGVIAVNIKRIHAQRNKDIIKAKPKRTGSKINIQANTCEYPNCKTVDVDLALCSSCGKYVCEKCNEIPINKLKQIIKVCESIHFLCKDNRGPISKDR